MRCLRASREQSTSFSLYRDIGLFDEKVNVKSKLFDDQPILDNCIHKPLHHFISSSESCTYFLLYFVKTI